MNVNETEEDLKTLITICEKYAYAGEHAAFLKNAMGFTFVKKDGDKVLLTQGPEGDEKGYTEVRMFTKSTEAFQWVLQQNYDQEDFPLDLDRMESDCLANLCELMGEPRW